MFSWSQCFLFKEFYFCLLKTVFHNLCDIRVKNTGNELMLADF